ncbi:MAG: BspA family leucine-rich repeat surface protein [Mangrovibacterium sp.]
MISLSAQAQRPFITTWELLADDLTITIPTYGAGYNFTINWGDGSPAESLSGLAPTASHTYASAGTKTVTIQPQSDGSGFPCIRFANAGDKDKIRTVEQWGDVKWENMNYAFDGCSNLVSVPDGTATTGENPDLTNVTNMGCMFRNAYSFNADISGWKVNNVTSMIHMFYGDSLFNADLSTWKVDNVTDMNNMFRDASSFNADLSAWKVDRVKNMKYMFANASSFSANLSTWAVDSVTDMSFMFQGASSFNADLSNWKVGNVTNMIYMFDGASSFNADLSNWDVGKITSMNFVFRNASSFNANLSAWDVSKVTSMSYMFSGATAFDSPLTWGSKTLQVKNMSYMFAGASNFNQDISGWSVDNVTTMRYMFDGDSLFNQDISGWKVNNVKDMEGMFRNAADFNQNISIWEVGNVTKMFLMFNGASSFNSPLEWGDKIPNITNLSYMFAYSPFNQDISNWNMSNIENMFAMFRGNSDFNQNISDWDVNKVRNMSYMFDGATNFNSPLDWGEKTASVATLTHMFRDASSFNQDIGGWDISALTTAVYMLNGSGLDRDNYDALLIGWNEQVQAGTASNSMSLSASGLKYCLGADARAAMTTAGWSIAGDSEDCSSVPSPFITTWEISESDKTVTIPIVDTLYYKFFIDWGDGSAIKYFSGTDPTASHVYDSAAGTKEVKIYPQTDGSGFPHIYFNNTGDKDKIRTVSQWGDVKWKSMNGAFYGCSNLSSVPGATTAESPALSEVEDMSEMFHSAYVFDANLLGWNVSGVADMSFMFQDASVFNQDISGWNISLLTSATSMLDNCGMSLDNYDALLLGWNAQVQANTANSDVEFGASGLYYCAGTQARKALIEKGWGDGITGDQSGNYTDIVDAGSLAAGYELTVSDNRIEVCTSLGTINLNDLVNYSAQNWRLRDGTAISAPAAFPVTGYPNGHLLTLNHDVQVEFCTDTFSDQGTLYLKISDEIEARDATAEVCLEEAEAINLSLLLGVLAEGSWSAVNAADEAYRTDNIFNGYDAYDENGTADQSFQFKFTPTSTSCLSGEVILTVVITRDF